MIFPAALGLTLMPCAAQDEPSMPERMLEQSKQMQEKMSQHFHKAWSGMKEAMPGSKGAELTDASMDLREQNDSYVMRLHLPERDIKSVEVNITDGRVLRVSAPASGAAGAYEQSVTLDMLVPGAKPEIEKRPDEGLVIIRIAKTPSEKKPTPEEATPSAKDLPESTDPWDVRMIEHMRRMGREMDDMFHEKADETPHRHDSRHWFDRRSFDSAYDLRDEGEQYVVRVYMPERSMEEVKVAVRDQKLIIDAVAEKCCLKKDGKMMIHHMSQYSQSISLPGPVDAGRVVTERKRGMLLIRIPKLKESASSTEKAAVD
jgi:HSP20 family molecular chaperone IbpA